ncbi:hypothetical protein [Companilactobacillus sp. DQM5]|uniref:hypothetical protein n=1 Tax=Companilactobacillus sp. DQM5 TaxID=3463359 RepID=UPI0040582EA8
MKIKKEVYGFMIFSLITSFFTVTDDNRHSNHRYIYDSNLYRNSRGELYKFVSSNGKLSGILSQDITVKFIYEKVDKHRIIHKQNELDVLKDNIYMHSNLLKDIHGSDPRGYVTSDIVKVLSGRLLYGTTEE